MHRTRTAQFKNPCSLRWPLVGMLLMLVLFGHDALMASEAEAGQLVLPGTLAIDTRDHTADRAVQEGGASSAPDQHHPHPDTDCGVNANVATFQGSGFSTQVMAPAVAVADLPVSAGTGASTASEPITPPSVRRALLQVYLI